MDEETRRIHRLLSDGKLSGPEAEEILQNALAAGRRKQTPKVRAIHYWAGAALAAAAALACPNCGGKMQLIACILERSAIRKILTHLGFPPDPPAAARARASPDPWQHFDTTA